jgi:eukaryotic-like serine/threonine-protein kinase
MVGKTVGKYRIIGLLGQGGMGTVYNAVDEILDRDVAIKVLNAELANAETIARFRTEAITLAKLNHPGIATIHELFQSDAELFMVMEYVRGETLDKLCERLGTVPPNQAAHLIDQILLALVHAHRAGIVHRDMKPANVMISDVGYVKIMDFGVASVRGAEASERRMMGTPAYMPPEQVLGEEVDGRADLYSVGVVLYRLLTGALPFTADDAMGMVEKQLLGTPAPLHVHRADLPGWCAPIVERAMAKSPADRFQTAEEFREALGKAAGIAATPHPAAPVIAPPPITAASAAPAHRRGEATIALPRKRTAVAGSLLAALGSIVVVVASVALWRHPVTSTTPPNVAAAGRPRVALPMPAKAVEIPSSAAIEQLVVAVPPGVTRTGASQSALAAPERVPIASAVSPSRAVIRPSTTTVAVDGVPAAPPRVVPEKPAGKTFGVPLLFAARVLVNEDDRQRERQVQVVLSDGTISVQAADDHDVLHAVPYERVLSISYSRGRDPLWSAPAPTRVARVDGGVLGLLRVRHWLSLRTTSTNTPFIVLRLGNDAEAQRVIGALEERTGRRVDVVPQGKDNRDGR